VHISLVFMPNNFGWLHCIFLLVVGMGRPYPTPIFPYAHTYMSLLSDGGGLG
jgi:hypothetical protein